MPKPVKKSLTSSDNSAFLSTFFLYLGLALFFFSIGIYTATFFEKQTIKHAPQKAEKMVFVQEVRNGSMVPLEGRSDTFDLSVRNDNDFINYVASFPTDIAGRVTVEEYLMLWNEYFSKNLPTATLVIYNEDGSETITMGQLQKAEKHGEKNRIDYTFRLLTAEELAHLTLSKQVNQKRSEKFENAALFIEAPMLNTSSPSLLQTLQQVK